MYKIYCTPLFEINYHIKHRSITVPFEFCDPPPPVSHGFMATPPENAYTILSEVRYQCHPGYRMKSISTLKCHSTGCWTPLELPQCIREDIYSKHINSNN